jgi:hypothetical protein
MTILKTVGRVFSVLLTTIAKTIGAMASPGGGGGAKTFDHDNAASICSKREDYRP